MFDCAEQHRGYDDVPAIGKRAEITVAVHSLYRDIDFLLLPTIPVLRSKREAQTIRVKGRDLDLTMVLIRYTCLFTHTEQAVVAMPSGPVENGVAASIQVVGKPDDDAANLDFAARLDPALSQSD